MARFHDRAAAEKALADFEARFRQHELPENMPEHTVALDAQSIPLTQVLKRVGLTASTSEAMRMIEQGGVRLNGEKVSDKALSLAQGSGGGAPGGQAQVRTGHPGLTWRGQCPGRVANASSRKPLDRVESDGIMRGFVGSGRRRSLKIYSR